MVSRLTKQKIADVLQAIADGEIKIEVLRQVLAEKYSFEPYTAFKRIALAPSSYLTSTDLREFLLDNKIRITSSDACDLIKALDFNKDGNLSYSEFLNGVLPKTDSALRTRVTLRQAYTLEEGERLPVDAEFALARVLEEELNSYQRIESLKRILNLSYDYTAGAVLRTLDYDDKGFVNRDDIGDFSDEVGIPFNDNQIDAIFRRIDIDLDNRINYSELADALNYPKSDIPVPSSPRRTATSPRRSSRNRSTELRTSIASPLKAEENKDAEYSDYLYESRRRSASPRRVQAEEIYSTPRKSVSKFDDAPIYSSKKKSPLREYDEEGLARALKEMINNSKELEITKNNLALRFDFNLFDAFRYFDFYGKGAYISSKQFEDGLAELKLYPTRDEVSLFFKRFDSDYDGLLRFTDFSNLLTPKSIEHARILESRKPRYVEEDEPIFTRETERLLGGALDLALRNEVHAEAIRQRLARRPLFNQYDAFKTIDKFDQGFITSEDFREILDDNGIFATNKDVNLLVERFKGVEGGTGKVSYSEFAREMSPKSRRIY